MRSTLRSTSVLIAAGAALAATVLGIGPASAASDHQQHAAPVFVQSDNPDGNTVVAYTRAADGTLRQAGVYATGGRGGVLDGSMVDHLASQGSLAYDAAHRLLYAVNAGSDTVTVFAVHGDRLERRQVLSSGGSFPVSVAVHGDHVYLLNALDGGSVQGFRLVGEKLRPVADQHRALGLDPSATPQFTHTPGQLAVTPDGRALVVTTKAGGQSIDVFPLGPGGAPSAAPVVNAEPGAVPFGFVFDAHGRLQVTEVGPGAVATFAVGRDGHLTPSARPPPARPRPAGWPPPAATSTPPTRAARACRGSPRATSRPSATPPPTRAPSTPPPPPTGTTSTCRRVARASSTSSGWVGTAR